MAPEVIEEGLHSRSDIMGECAVYMAAYSIETAGVRDLLISMLRTSSIETVVAVSYTHLDVYKRQQYQLIMECRSSGLSNYQWCTEHNINPGTFYNWVKRLRKKLVMISPLPQDAAIISQPLNRML